jgi:hypothetical protein
MRKVPGKKMHKKSGAFLFHRSPPDRHHNSADQ